MFLDSIREQQQEEERLRKERDGEEVKNFREWVCLLLQLLASYDGLCRAVAARTSAANTATASTTSVSNAAAKPKPSVATKKDIKKTLKGVVVKKKAKIVPAESEKASSRGKDKADNPPDDNEVPPNAKRRKIAS
jgi:hypothetical protein